MESKERVQTQQSTLGVLMLGSLLRMGSHPCAPDQRGGPTWGTTGALSPTSQDYLVRFLFFLSPLNSEVTTASLILHSLFQTSQDASSLCSHSGRQIPLCQPPIPKQTRCQFSVHRKAGDWGWEDAYGGQHLETSYLGH